MRTILAIIFTTFATQASAAYHSFFQGKIMEKPTYSECTKAIEKGVEIVPKRYQQVHLQNLERTS